MPVRAVLFDWEGTLVREDSVFLTSPAAAVARYARRKLGFELPADTFDEALEAVIPGPEGPSPRIDHLLSGAFAMLGRELTGDELAACCRVFFDTATHRYHPYEDAHDLLHELRRRGVRTGVITNSIFPASAFPTLLQDLEVRHLLDLFLTSADTGIGLPDPKPFEVALAALGIPACEAAFISTRLDTGLRGARAAGLTGVLLSRWGPPGRTGGALVVEDLAGVAEILLPDSSLA